MILKVWVGVFFNIDLIRTLLTFFLFLFCRNGPFGTSRKDDFEGEGGIIGGFFLIFNRNDTNVLF